MQLRTEGEDSHKQENISILDLNYSMIGIEWLVSVSNHWTIPLKSLTQKQLYFQGSRLARIYSHTQQHCLPVLKSLTTASTLQVQVQRWLSLICPHNFPPLMYDWYTLHCCVTCPIIGYVIDRQVCHSLHSSFSCKNLSCVVSLLVLAKGIIHNGATPINILYEY